MGIKNKLSAALLVAVLLLFSSICEGDAGSRKPSSDPATVNFISDYIKFLYEIKKVEDPKLTKALANALHAKSEESFITTWIQYAHNLENALDCIKPYGSNAGPDIRKISESLIAHLEPLISDFNHIISINLTSGVYNEEFKEVMSQLNGRLLGFFEQIQASAIEITDMVTVQEGNVIKCTLTDKQLGLIASEIELFVGDDLMKLEDIGLEDIVFGKAGEDIALPHYLWSALFIKVYVDSAIARRQKAGRG